MTDFTEADLSRSIARSFGHETSTDRAERPLTLEEALEIVCLASKESASLSPHPRLEEARTMFRGSSPQTPAAQPDHDLTGLVEEVATLAQAKLRMSQERAMLHAQSEALRAREFSSSVSEAVTKLRQYRDGLRNGPPGSEVDLDRMIAESFRQKGGH